MRRSPANLFLVISVMLIIVGTQTAHAGKLNLTPARFVQCEDDGANCIAQNGAFEKFMAEYAFGISPKILSPAGTLGYSGFYIGLESSVVGVPSNGVSDFTGENYEDARWRIGSGKYGAKPPAMFHQAIHVRKGLPWSVELGTSMGFLAKSDLVTLGAEIKWSLFEGYREKALGYFPDLAVRGAVNRVLGQSDIDLTVVGADASISYLFGLGGMVSLTPYAGYQLLWSIIRTEPMIMRTDSNSFATFHPPVRGSYDIPGADFSEPNLMRQKAFLGFNLRYELLSITMDWALGLPQSWTTKEAGNDVNVKVNAQLVYSLGVGLHF